jgi:hypothetical protein
MDALCSSPLAVHGRAPLQKLPAAPFLLPHGRELSSPPMASILWASPCSPAPCQHPLFLLSLPAPSPKQQVPAPPTSPMENNKPPLCPGVLAAQLGLASSLSGHPSRCSTARTTCTMICSIGCVWSCWCSAQRLRDATDLRSAYESSSKPAVSSLLPRVFCVRLKGRTNESHNKLCNDCVCRLIAALVDVTPCVSLVGKEPQTNGMHARHESARLFALYDCDLFYLRIRSMMCLRVYMRVKINCMNEHVYRRK